MVLNVQQLAREIRALAYNAYGATMVGSPALSSKRFYEATKALAVGDLVVEITTIWRPERDSDAVGYLREIAFEPVDYGPDAEPWDEAEEGRPHPTEKVYYINTLDGRQYRWVNASFIAAPTKLISGL